MEVQSLWKKTNTTHYSEDFHDDFFLVGIRVESNRIQLRCPMIFETETLEMEDHIIKVVVQLFGYRRCMNQIGGAII